MPNSFQLVCKDRSAYSLIEVVIAGFILVTAITGAAMLAHNLLGTEENNFYSVHALNVQEQAAKLYALGLDPVSITNILPERFTNASLPPAGALYFTNTTGSTNISGVGSLETNLNTMVFFSGQSMNQSNFYRTNSVTIVRPSIR